MANTFFNFDKNIGTAPSKKVAPKIDFSKLGLQDNSAKDIPEEEVPVSEQEPDDELEELESIEPVDLFNNDSDNEKELEGFDANPVAIDPADETVSVLEDPAIVQAEQEKEKEAKTEEVTIQEPEAVPEKAVTDSKLKASDTELVKPAKKVTRRKRTTAKTDKPAVEESSSKPEAVQAASEDEVSVDTETVTEVQQEQVTDMSVFAESKYTTDEVVDKVMSKFSDAKFEKFRDDISTRLGKIKITEDMPPGAIKFLLQDLDCISNDMFQFRVDVKTMYNSLTSKLGYFAANVALNTPGKTAADKERNRSLAFMNAEFYNEKINFLPIIESIRYRKIFLEEVETYMDEKRHAIYSALADNKTEADLLKVTE